MYFYMENISVLSGLGTGHQNEKMLKWKVLKWSHFHFLEDTNAKEIVNSHFKEQDLSGHRHPGQGGSGVGGALISMTGTAIPLLTSGITAGFRMQCCLAVLCVFSLPTIQRIFIATYHTPSSSLGVLDIAKKSRSHWHCSIPSLCWQIDSKYIHK